MKNSILLVCCLIWGLTGLSQNDPNYVDFEPGAGHSPVESNAILNPFFLAEYGVRFYCIAHNGAPVTAKYAKVGPPMVAFRAVPGTLVNTSCPYTGSDDNPFAVDPNSSDPNDTETGCWFLTDGDGDVKPQPYPLHVDYDVDSIQCTIASGHLYDIDGSGDNAEAWKIDLYTVASGSSIEKTIYLASPNYSYNTCPSCTVPQGATIYNLTQTGSGNGQATYWELQTNGSYIEKIIFTYVGAKDRNVGVAFDQFYYCSSKGGEQCDMSPDFGYTVQGCGVQFNNATTSGTGVAEYFWDFGNGLTSTEENPFVQFSSGATITATLTVTAFNGIRCCKDTISKTITVGTCEACHADVSFSWSPDQDCPDDCLMTITAIVNNNTTPVLGYLWDFGNGTFGYGKQVTHDLNGSAAQICLTVILESQSGNPNECCTFYDCEVVDCGTSGSGNSDALSDNPVEPPALNLFSTACDYSFGFTHQTLGCGTQFTSYSSANPAQVITYHWDFGDGTSTREKDPEHLYGTPGTYVVTLTVTGTLNQDCCEKTYSDTITVYPCVTCDGGPQFSWTKDANCDPCYFTFQSWVVNNTTPIVAYLWDFGNGDFATGDSVRYKVANGTQVCLTVFYQYQGDSEGACCTETICATINCGENGNTSEPIDQDGGLGSKAQPEEELQVDDLTSPVVFDLKIYPNPAQDKLHLEWKGENRETLTLRLVSTSGQVVRLMENQESMSGENHLVIDVSTLPEGMYLLQMEGSHARSHEVIRVIH